MTAKFLNNYPARNAVRIISQNRKFAIVTCILSLLGIPLFFGAGMAEVYLSTLSEVRENYSYSFSCEPYMLIGGFCGAVAILLGIFCGIRAFEEEWNKTRVDMLYALPLNGTQRFFSNYLGGFAMYAVPYLVAVLLGWIIMLITVPMVNALHPAESDFFNNLYLDYFLGSLGLFALMWMYYTISAVCASCCGTLFENIYTNILLNLLIPGTFAAVLAVITYNVDGLDFEYSWEFIGYTSPIGGLIYLVYLIAEKGSLDDFEYYYGSSYTGVGGTAENTGLIPAYIRWIIVILLITAALLVLAWKLYQHRKAEQVSRPFVYIWLYYVIISAITVCILCISAAEESAIIAVLLFSAIVYFIMEVIRKRGFKKFWLSIVTYIATVAVAVGGYVLTIATDCFGRTKYIPAVATVTSAEITFNFYEGGRSTEYQLTYKDRETISKIQEFQKNYFSHHDELKENLDALSEKNPYTLDYYYEGGTDGYKNNEYTKYGPPTFDTSTFTVTYHTIAGTSIHRSYSLCPDERIDLIKIYAQTDAYAEAQGRLMKNRLRNEMRQYNDKIHEYEIPETASFKAVYSDIYSDTRNAQEIYLQKAENSVNTLSEWYQNDMKALSFDQLCKDEILCYIQGLPVYASCSGTVAFLKDHGFTEFNFTEILQNSKMNNNSNLLEIRIYAPENYKTASLNYPSYQSGQNENKLFSQPDNFSYRDTILLFGGHDIELQYPKLNEVLHHVRTHYISAEPCYLMLINGENYLIPAEYSDSVEELIQLGNYYYNSHAFGYSTAKWS